MQHRLAGNLDTPRLNRLSIAVYTAIYTMHDITGTSPAYHSILLHIVSKSVQIKGATYIYD